MVSLKERWESFWANTIRVLRVTRKPSLDEFKTVSKVAGLGLLAMGLLGFLLQIVLKFILTGTIS